MLRNVKINILSTSSMKYLIYSSSWIDFIFWVEVGMSRFLTMIDSNYIAISDKQPILFIISLYLIYVYAFSYFLSKVTNSNPRSPRFHGLILQIILIKLWDIWSSNFPVQDFTICIILNNNIYSNFVFFYKPQNFLYLSQGWIVT